MNKIFLHIGNWGKYQVFVYAVCFLPFMLSGNLTLLSTFTAGVPNTRCRVPEFDDNTTNYDTPFEMSVANHLFAKPTLVSNAHIYCYYCNVSFITEKRNCTEELTKNKCSQYIYDKSQFHTSVVSLFNMVCDKVWMGEFLRSLYMIGVIFGAAIFGVIGDRFGRRKTFFVGGSLQIVVCNVVPFATNYCIYCILQFLVGALQIGTYLTSFVVVMELFGGLPKTIFGIWVQGIFAVGYIYVGVSAYFIRNWRLLTWAVSLPTLLYIPCFYAFPESVSWLLSKNRSEQARTTVEKIAKWNGVKVPDLILSDELTVCEKQEVQQANILDLFRNLRMGTVTLIVFFICMINSLIYYGLSWNTSSLPGNPYMNFIICGLVEIPAFVFCIPLMEHFGRRSALLVFLLTSGISCTFSAFINQTYAILIFTFMGKLCIAAASAIICNYCTEIFPTVVRNAGTGFGLLMGRIGSIAAPQIYLFGNYVDKRVPLIIFGSCGIVAAALGWFLPETKGRQLPETMDDGIKLVNSRK